MWPVRELANIIIQKRELESKVAEINPTAKEVHSVLQPMQVFSRSLLFPETNNFWPLPLIVFSSFSWTVVPHRSFNFLLPKMSETNCSFSSVGILKERAGTGNALPSPSALNLLLMAGAKHPPAGCTLGQENRRGWR